MLGVGGTADFMPHGTCLLWSPPLLAVHAAADFVIFASYFVIPLAIVRFLRARRDMRYAGTALLFAAFIWLCGVTHLLGLVTLWVPMYEVQGVAKVLTAMVSAATAAVLFPLLPRLIALPSPAQLQRANASLEEEIASHRATLAELERARQGLEQEVAERTRELSQANERLKVVSRETVHRSRNLLGVVQALARQTAQFARTKEELVASLSARLGSLGAALSQVSDSNSAGVDLRGVVETQLDHYLKSFPGRIAIAGPATRISQDAAQQIGLAVHELATNALKYGALSGSEGRVELSWQLEDQEDGPQFRIAWREEAEFTGALRDERSGGGFGSQLLTRAVPDQLHGRAVSELRECGYFYELRVPAAMIAEDSSAQKINPGATDAP